MTTLELVHPSRRRADRVVEERVGGLRRGQLKRTEPGTGGVASLFAAGRPCDGDRISHRPPCAFDARASAETWILEQGLRQLDPQVRQRVVAGWRTRVRGPRTPLICDEGCDVCIGGVAAADLARAALLEWLPLSRTDLAVFEGGLFADDPAGALAVLVRPPTIWSFADAVAADSLLPRRERFDPERFDAIASLAGRCVGDGHLRRMRRAVAKIERQLPIQGLPCASATVAAGCVVIATDDDRCAKLAARQLARYASSALVARATPESSGFRCRSGSSSGSRSRPG